MRKKEKEEMEKIESIVLILSFFCPLVIFENDIGLNVSNLHFFSKNKGGQSEY